VAEFGLDLILGDGIRNPSLLLAAVDAGVACAPGQVAEQEFRLALAPSPEFFQAAVGAFGDQMGIRLAANTRSTRPRQTGLYPATLVGLSEPENTRNSRVSLVPRARFVGFKA
jgi:hypothetical protein